MSESSVDKSIVPEYSELLNIDENKSTAELPSTIITNKINNNNNNINNNKGAMQFGEVEMTSVEISPKPAVLPPSIKPVKAIEKQIETRRADGKRRITPMFMPLSLEQERYVDR